MRPDPVALTLALWVGGVAAADTMTFLGASDWVVDTANGVSGLELSDDGLFFEAVSDRGWSLSGQIPREDGRIKRVIVSRVTPLLGHDGMPVTARRLGDWSDAEGLAILPDGTRYVAFERWAHVYRYDSPDGQAVHIRDHPEFALYRENRQLEAIAADSVGTIYAFAETPAPGTSQFPVFRLDGTDWTIAGQIQQMDGFAIVGADFDERDRLYLLERKLVLGLWWQSRIRRFDTPDGAGEILWTSRRGEHTNLEGIALWHDDQGLRITMVSDNNQDPDEPTQFVEYRLTE
jgi:hypothetical protein